VFAAPDPVLMSEYGVAARSRHFFVSHQTILFTIWGDAMTANNLLDRLREILANDFDRKTKGARIAAAIREANADRWVGVYDVDIERGLVSNIAWSGPGAPAYPIFPITEGLTSRAIAEKRTVNVGDVANDPSYLTALESTRSEMIVPVLDKTGAVIGTIDIESEHLNAFDLDAQALLEECARLLAAFWSGV
jgi:L-methionine (R)-S-oxide reductase